MSKWLFLSHSAASSGAELGMLRLLRNFAPGRTAVVFAAEGPLVTGFRRAGIETHVRILDAGAAGVKRGDRSLSHLLRSIGGMAAYGWRLGTWVAGKDVSVIVAYSVKSLIYGAVAARRARVPLVWRVSDRIAPDYFGWVNTIILRLMGLLLPNGLIVNSKSTLDTVWTGRKPVIILPPGIDISPTEIDREYARPLKQIAMVGRLSPWKGQMEFLEAFERVFTGTEVTALIIGGALFGEEEYEQALRTRVANGPCAAQIKFTGAVNNVGELLRSSEILVHASVIPEPFGAVVLEGLDAGCSVIATRPGGPAEVITNDEDGLLVPCGDVDALEGALRRLWLDSELRERLSRAGKKTAMNYDIRLLAGEAESWLSRLE